MSAKSSLLLLLQLLLIAICHAVQLSDLVRRRRYFGAYSILPFSDDTVLVSGFSGLRTFEQLRLHPIVTVPNPPPRLSSTILLARIYPANLTVIWATAITTMDISVDLAVDPADNVYAASNTLFTNTPHDTTTIQIIKYNPSGARVFHVYHPSPQGKPTYIYNSEFPDFARLSFLPPNKLVITGSVISSPFEPGIPGLLTFSAKNGRFIRSQGHPFPPMVEASNTEYTTVDVARTRRGPIACYALEANNGTFTGINRLYARCANLKSSKRLPLTRQIDITNKKDDFYFARTSVLEKNPSSKRQPSLFVAYERVLFTTRRKSVNELFIRRLDSDTLEDVDWATGQKSASARPIIISLPEPAKNSNAHTSFVLSMKYSTKARSVALLLWTSTAIKKFVPEPKGGGKITAIKERKGPIGQHQLFFFDQKRQLTTQPVSTDGISPNEMTFNRDESCVYVFGFFLELRNVSNPLVGGGC